MIKRTIAHREELSVPVNLVKSDWASELITEDDGIQRVKAGTLISLKTSSEDIRIDGTDVIPFPGTGTADAVLLNDVEFKITSHTNEPGTALLEGIVYLNKLIEVDSTVTKAMLPEKITYVDKNRQ